MAAMTTQLISATALSEDKGLVPNQVYLFSFQVSDKGLIRIVTTNDIEVYYASVHDFLICWTKISSLGWANDKETYQKMLEELQNGVKD